MTVIDVLDVMSFPTATETGSVAKGVSPVPTIIVFMLASLFLPGEQEA